MSYEADYEDLARHGREITAHESFLYGVFDAAETALFGCIYVDPSDEFDAQVSWWVVDELVGADLERTLDEFVPRWMSETWRFSRVDYSPGTTSSVLPTVAAPRSRRARPLRARGEPLADHGLQVAASARSVCSRAGRPVRTNSTPRVAACPRSRPTTTRSRAQADLRPPGSSRSNASRAALPPTPSKTTET